MPDTATLGDVPTQPKKIDLSAGVVKKKTPKPVTTTTQKAKIDLSAGIVSKKATDKPAAGAAGSLWDKATRSVFSSDVERNKQQVASLRKESEELKAGGHNIEGAATRYLADTSEFIGRGLEGITSPVGLGLTALSIIGGPEIPTALKAARATAGVALTYSNAKAAIQPKQPDEDWYSYVLNRGAAAVGAVSGAAGSTTEFKDVMRDTLRKTFGLTDDLADKAAVSITKLNKAEVETRQKIADTRRAQIKATQEIDEAKAQKVKATQQAVSSGMKQLDPTASPLEKQIAEQLAELQKTIPEMDSARVAAGTQIVADTVRTLAMEQSRLSATFDDIGRSIKKPLGTAEEINSIIDGEASKAGIQQSEVPHGARAALPKPSGGAVLFGEPVTDASFLAKLREQGALPEGDQIGFDQATRIKDDLYEHAAKTKDGAVRQALYNSADRLSDMQEKAAEDAGQGDRYTKTKSEYKAFRRGIGSREMLKWVWAERVKQQQVLPKIASLALTGTPAQRSAQFGMLRTILKEYDIPTRPFDDLLKQQNAAEIERKALSQEQMKEVSASGKERIAKAEAEGSKVIPGRKTSELQGKSLADLKGMKLEGKTTSNTFRNGMKAYRGMMILYGLSRLFSGQGFGLFQVGLGGAYFLPDIVRYGPFQDWVIGEMGVPPASSEGNRLRGVVSSWYPFLRRAAQSQVPAAAATGFGEVPNR